MWKFASSSSKVDEKRRRKLLLTKRQITVLAASVKQPGITIVPLEVIQDDRGLVKLNVALVKGRKKFDKRNVIKEKDIKRGIERDRKKYNI
jgi:SsrA-binding protein